MILCKNALHYTTYFFIINFLPIQNILPTTNTRVWFEKKIYLHTKIWWNMLIFKIGPFGCHSLIQIKDFCARQKTSVKRFKIWHISGKRKPNQKKIILHFALLLWICYNCSIFTLMASAVKRTQCVVWKKIIYFFGFLIPKLWQILNLYFKISAKTLVYN